MGMDGWLRVGAVLLVAFGTTACSDSDDESGGGGTGGASFDAGPMGGTGGTAGTNTGTGGSGGMTGGSGGMMPTAGMDPTAMCDPSIETTATCGGVSCPAGAGLNACQVPCCAGDQCGYRDRTMGAVTDCTATPPEDPDCPDIDIGLAVLQGCCYDGNICGALSRAMNACVIEYGMFPQVAEQSGRACDGSDNDGGTAPADAGADSGP